MKSGQNSRENSGQNGKAARIIVAFAMSVAFTQAWAQYVWTDEKGVRQYSDRPPPASVPDSRIIRGKGQGAVTPAPSSANEAAAAGTPAKTAPTLAERNADFNKRRTQQAENEKKAAAEQQLAEQKKTNCERAANYKRTLESGVRIGRVNSNGERILLNDEQREQELREAQKALESCAG